MAQYPYLPLFVTDYRSATDHLTDSEHGIYLQLLMLMWQSPGCRIPDDDDWIARRLRRNADAVRSHVRPLMREFCVAHNGWVTQKRLQQEWQWRKEKSERNSKSAKSRWDKEKDISERNASTHSKRNAPTLPYPTPQKEEERKKEKTGKILLPDLWKPTAGHFELAASKGLSSEAVTDAIGEMRSWSLGNGEKRANWDWVFNNWLRRNAQKRMNGNGHGKPQRTVQDAATDLLAKVRGFDEPAPSGVRGGTSENAPRLLPKG
jgi:uncharacterized protein YdaU (DUF1376 family)